MAIKKKTEIIEVELQDEYKELSGIIVGCTIVEFKNGKATVHADTIEKIKNYIKVAE